jgi:hypothetical protein
MKFLRFNGMGENVIIPQRKEPFYSVAAGPFAKLERANPFQAA